MGSNPGDPLVGAQSAHVPTSLNSKDGNRDERKSEAPMIAKNAGNSAGAKGCRFEIIPKAGWTASKLNRATRQREPTRSVKRNTHRAWTRGLKRFQPDDVVSITDPNRFGVSIFPRAMESNGHWAYLALKTGS